MTIFTAIHTGLQNHRCTAFSTRMSDLGRRMLATANRLIMMIRATTGGADACKASPHPPPVPVAVSPAASCHLEKWSFPHEIHMSVDNVPLTMSSIEIASLTGKSHRNVLRDIRKMLRALDIPALKFERCYRGEDGKSHPAFYLPKRETTVLVSGYSVAMRAKIVDRWMELKAAIATPHEAVVTALDPMVAATITGIVHKELQIILPGMVESALIADTRAVATEYKPALAILIERKVPTKKRRGFSQKVSSRLRKFSTVNGLPMRVSRETGRYLFHVDAVAKWMARDGKALIAEHLASMADQPQFCLVPMKR